MSEGLPLYVLLSACEYMTCFCHVVPEGSLSLTCPSVVDSRLHPHSQIPIIHLTFTSPHPLFQAPHTNIPTTHRHYIHPDPSTHNSPASMTDATTSTPNLTPRELEILFAMCKSFKSKPDVCNRIRKASRAPKDLKPTNNLVRPSRSTWNCSPLLPSSPPLAAPLQTSTRS